MKTNSFEHDKSKFFMQSMLTSLLAILIALSAQFFNFDLKISSIFFDENSKQFFLPKNYLIEEILFNIYLIFLFILFSIIFLVTIKKKSYLLSKAIFLTLFFSVFFTLLLKYFTMIPRPYMLGEFGGKITIGEDFLTKIKGNLAGGLPSSHALCGYILLIFYFSGIVLKCMMLRFFGLGLGIFLGFIISVIKVAQGLHFFSQTVWSFIIVWCVSSIVFYLFYFIKNKNI